MKSSLFFLVLFCFIIKVQSNNYNDSLAKHINRQDEWQPFSVKNHKSNSKLKSSTIDITHLDSVYLYTFNSPKDSFIFRTVYYKYDENGNETMYERYELDPVTKTMYGETKGEYKKDINGNELLHIYYKWNETLNQWEGEDKYEYTFDENGNRTQYISYSWDKVWNKWLSRYKKEEQYFPSNKLKKIIEFDWNEVFSKWDTTDVEEYSVNDEYKIVYSYSSNVVQSGSKYEYQYKYGKLTTQIDYTLNVSTKVWKAWTKVVSELDTLGRITKYYLMRWEEDSAKWINEPYKYEYLYNNNTITETHYDYENNVWIETFKTEKTYNEFGDVVLGIFFSNENKKISYKYEQKYDDNRNLILRISYGWDELTQKWVFGGKKVYKYDSKNRLILSEPYQWNTTALRWEGLKYKEEYSFDNQGNQTLFAEYDWDSKNLEWIYSYKKESLYDLNNNEILRFSFIFNEETVKLDTTSKKEWIYENNNCKLFSYYKRDSLNTKFELYQRAYYFPFSNIKSNSTSLLNQKSLNVYPNPVKDELLLDGFNNFEVLNVFDYNGRLVLRESKTNKIDVSMLRSGTYFIRVFDKGKTWNHKFIKF